MNIHDPLYKYLPRKYTEGIINEGILRIGTLYDFRRVEEYGYEIGDDDEGINQFLVKPNTSGSTHIDHLSASGVNIRNVTAQTRGNIFNLKTSGPNLYTFCSSQFNDRSLLNVFDADSCVVIHDQMLFFKAVTHTLNSMGLLSQPGMKVDCCAYERKNVVLSDQIINHTVNNIPYWLHKDIKYQHQGEVRAVWLPTSENPEPVIIQSDEIKKACKLLY